MEPKDEEGNDRYLFFDTDCLALIDKTYNIAKKKVIISSALFYLDDDDRVIRPLKESHKMGQGHGCKWKDAYQALKHDRYESLKQYGTIYNLFHALAALYILNIFFKDEIYDLPDGRFDERLDSRIFSVIVYKVDNVSINVDGFSDININAPKDVTREEALYILKLRDADAQALFDAFVEDCSGPEPADNRKVWYNVGTKQKRSTEGSPGRGHTAGQDGFMPRKRLDNGLGAVRLTARSIQRSAGLAH